MLFLSPQPFFQWRGSPIRVKYNLEALAESGYEVDLLTLPFGEDCQIPGVRIHRVGPLPGVRDLPIGPSFAKLLFDFKLAFAARRLMRRHPYAVLHGVEDAGFFGVLLTWRKPVRLIYEKHSDPASYRKGFLRNLVMGLYARVEAFTIRRADGVIATGDGLARAVRSLCPTTHCTHVCDIPSSRVEADSAEEVRLREELREHPGEILATYVGSFAVYQGIDLLFEALPVALRQSPLLRVLVIGGSEPEIAVRREALRQEGLDSRVTFAGKVSPERLPAYLAASDILLSPRVSGHNTPLKLLDYLKVGRCILATDVEANRLILTEETAVFAAPDASVFGRALSELSMDAEHRSDRAARGRHLIETTYNFTRYREQLAAVYHEVLGQISN